MAESKSFNFNSLLLTILLAIGGWTLQRVISLGESIAVGASTAAAQAKATDELRARIVQVEAQVQANQLEITRIRERLR